MVAKTRLEERPKNYRINYKILRAEIEEYRNKLWKRNRFCKCGASSLEKCSCELEKRERYRKRVHDKINEKFGERLNAALTGQLPKV
jgi:hypothetical protein